MIEIKHLRKEYETITPINDLSVTINDGDVISIIGPSGTGKSTFLRMINRLEKPTSGQIIIDGDDITNPNFSLNKISGKIVMVFQNFNLFNHMTVLENVCYAPIKLKKMDKQKVYQRANELLEEVGLSNFAFSYPSSLSGGQKQRAAIARAIAMDPEVILFDEPTSALDPTMTGEIELIIKKLATQGYTMLLVTHNMSLAETVSNRVFYMDEGGLYEDGTPEQIFHNQKREKTKIFVKQLKSLTGSYKADNFDFMDLYSQISNFAYKNEMNHELEEKIKAVFEEVCFQIIGKNFKGEKAKLDFDLQYSPIEKEAEFKVEYQNFDVDLESIDNKLSWEIVKHYASDIKIEKIDDIKTSINMLIK